MTTSRLFNAILWVTVFTFTFLPKEIFAQTPCDEGAAGGFPCGNVNLMSSMSLAELSGSSANDIWGWTSPNTEREYAIIGLNNGYAFVDITNPVAPVKIGNLPTHSGNSDWGDIKVNNNYAYLVSESSGHHIQIFSLFQLDGITNPPIIFDDNHYTLATIGNGNAHNIVIDEESDFAYSVGTNSLCSGGLAAFDLSNPANPSFAGCFSGDGYSHDAVCFVYRGVDTEHIGKQICIGFNEDTYTIVDMTNKSNPIQLARAGYSGVNYTHQGWVTDDHGYLMLNDEGDESGSGVNTSTYIFNIADLDNPFYINTYVGPTSAIDHNLYVKGNYVYEANYAAGLRILDATDIANGNLTEAAYFDFYTNHNNASFVSVWSSYPYFKSGNVVVSDFEQGLFVVQPQLPHFVMDLPEGGVRTICAGEDAVFEIDLTAYAGFSGLVNLSVAGLPDGASASFSNNNTDPMGNTQLTISDFNGAGKYSLLVNATATGSPDQKIALGLIINGLPPKPILQMPENGAEDVPTTPELEWTVPFGSSIYEVEVATDVVFSTIVFSQNNINGLSLNVPPLEANTTYYWRVRGAGNECNPIVPWSLPFSFLTENVVQVAETSTDVPVDISPDDTPTITSILTINDAGIISDINVLNLEIEHTYTGDLIGKLRSPTGTEITLFERPGEPASTYGCNQNDVLLDFDDSAGLPYNNFEETCNNSGYSIEGTFQPMNALSAFHGENMQGEWMLTIEDVYPQDGGALLSWGLQLFSDAALPLALIDFQATNLTNSIKLNWSVEDSYHIKTFELERSEQPTVGFQRIGEVAANNKRTFDFEDNAIKAGVTYYYRLRQTSMDEKVTFSNIITAKIHVGSGFELLPNPAGKEVVVQLMNMNSDESDNVSISLMSLEGKIIKEQTSIFENQIFTFDLAGLAKGIYLVKVQTEKGVEVKRLMKQ